MTQSQLDCFSWDDSFINLFKNEFFTKRTSQWLGGRTAMIYNKKYPIRDLTTR